MTKEEDILKYYYNYEKQSIKNTLRYMPTKHPDLYNKINDYIKESLIETDKNKQFIMKFYCYVHQIELPKCKHQDCNNQVKYKKGEFNDFCSIRCCNTSNYKQKKIKETWNNKSDEEHQDKINKFKKTYKENYNKFKDNIINSKKILNLNNWSNKEYIIDNFIDKNKKFKLYDFMNYFNCSQPKAHAKLKELNIIYDKTNKMYSQAEKEVVDYIKSIIPDSYTIQENIRINNKEFDILIYNENKIILGIEYNGLYWHSYNKNSKRPKKYYELKHIIKTEIAEENEFQLLHIFENEWNIEIKRNIWKSIISSKLRLSANKVAARKCIIKEVQSKEANAFINLNHAQGINNRGSIRLGLYYNNELVSIMTFGTPQFSKEENTYEIIRMCNKLNYNIQGGFSKLLKYFKRNYEYKNIISYANRRWSSNIKESAYLVNGFKLHSISKPNNYYIKNNKLYHRKSFQKHRIKAKLHDRYDDNISALNNAILYLNTSIIWDCGNYKYSLL